MKHRNEKGLRIFLALVALAAPGGLAHAAEVTRATIDQIGKELTSIQNHLTNATLKAKHGMLGSAGGPADDGVAGKPATFAEGCCLSNIEHIQENLAFIARSIEQLDVHYAARRETAALTLLNEIRGEWSTVSRGIAVFKMAGTQARAQQALVSIVSPFNRLRSAIERLGACCGEEAANPGGRGGGQR